VTNRATSIGHGIGPTIGIGSQSKHIVLMFIADFYYCARIRPEIFRFRHVNWVTSLLGLIAGDVNKGVTIVSVVTDNEMAD